MAIYELVVASGGSKLKESTMEAPIPGKQSAASAGPS